MLKKTISLITVFALVFVMTACGADSGKLYDYDLTKYVKLAKYKGIKAEEVTPEAVTDDAITAEIQTMLESNSELKEVDSKIEDGDTVNASYEGSIDGKKVDKCCAENSDISIGSGQLIDGFESGLIGHVKGDKVTLNLKFPEDYGDESINGKDVVFVVTINSVSRSFVPELNDEFVKTKSGTDCKTVDELKAFVKKGLEEDNALAAKQQMQSAIFQKIFEKTEIIGYPEKELESYKQEMIQYYEQYAAQSGTDLDSFLQTMGTDKETFMKEANSAAEQQVGQDMIVLSICRAEGIEVTEDKYKEGVQKYVDAYGFESIEEFEKQYPKSEIMLSFYYEECLNFLLDNAKIVKASSEKKADAADKSSDAK